MGQNVSINGVKAVVLAGAQEWGDCPLRLASPRPLAPIANQPLLAHTLAALREAGICEVVLCANGHTQAFRRVFGDGSSLGISVQYSEDQMPRGPAGCIKDASDYLGDAEFLVVEGGLLPDVDFSKLVAEHRRSAALVTVGVDASVPRERWTAGFGPLPVGLYVFSPKVHEQIAPIGYQDIKESLLPRLYAAGENVAAVVIEGAAPRVMGPESYLAINAWALERMVARGLQPDGHLRRGEAYVHETVSLDPSARLVGPVIIGPRTTVRPSAVIIGPTSIGAACAVGDFAVVSNSAIWDDVTIGRSAQVEQSIMAYGTSAGPEAQVIHTVCLGRKLKASERATLASRYALGRRQGVREPQPA